MLFTVGASVYFMKRSGATIDNSIFFLHYRVTCMVLLFCSELSIIIQYFWTGTSSRKGPGDAPIDCIVDSKSVDQSTMEMYCWMDGIYVVDKCVRQGESAYLGVTQQLSGDKIRRQEYYQWVVLILFLMALCSYIPHYLWKSWEGGHVKVKMKVKPEDAGCVLMLVGNLYSPVVEKESKDREKNMIIQYLTKNNGFYTTYLVAYCFCEFLNLFVVSMEFLVLDRFFGLKLETTGEDIVNYISGHAITNSTCVHPLRGIEVNFPVMAKCTFPTYGPGGNVIPHDGLCVLPGNMINQKIFVGLWIWFNIIWTLTLISLVYHLLTICVPIVRRPVMEANLRLSNRHNDYVTLSQYLHAGDWFIMRLLAKNMDSIVYREILSELPLSLEKEKEIRLNVLKGRNVEETSLQ